MNKKEKKLSCAVKVVCFSEHFSHYYFCFCSTPFSNRAKIVCMLILIFCLHKHLSFRASVNKLTCLQGVDRNESGLPMYKSQYKLQRQQNFSA